MATLTDVVEIVVQGTVPTTGSGTKNIFNVFHYQSITHPRGEGPVAVADAFLTQIWATIAAALSVTYTGVATLARFLDDATAQYQNASVPASGVIVGGRVPLDNAVVYLLRTLQRGKSFRGSKHFGSIPTSDVTNDELNAAGLTHWTAVTPLLSQQVNTGFTGYTPCVVSRMLSQLSVNPTNIQGSNISAALLNKTLGTMRRRKEKTVR